MDLSYLAELPKEEFVAHRQRVFEQMQENSAFIVFTETEKRRNADCNYLFRPDSYFWYLTGFAEPEAALLLIKQNGQYESSIFVRNKDPLMETWHGYRLGVDAAAAQLNVDKAFDIEDLSLIFAEKTQNLTACYYAEGIQRWGDPLVNNVFTEVINWQPMLSEMRLFKSPAELALIQQACHISSLAHIRAMRQTRPNRYEMEIEGEIQYEFSRFGVRFPAYNSIVASGKNACILHYNENNQVLKDGELLLIDAGAEFAYYASDITRTFPINGKFSLAQREIYQLVLDAMKAATQYLVPNGSFKAANQAAMQVMTEGLVRLGILQGDITELLAQQAVRQYYLHGLGHWLGLDVHDVGDYGMDKDRTLASGMVLTLEPGIYIPIDADVPAQYRGIGVRIEDDLLITEYGNKNLTCSCPKEIADIEAIMAQK
ncbi:Xaa-Pro aminopeptidase [[Haemophilus] ducreyi]|uniref:Xaa-Pro aminopeptidase n=2 Tax=Haemophilus ducreyi TaxID=730 RepID=Q7VLL1_HAEDU|nr:Xaa-Pro aminopeptidase [[Haemophilus] ducreyi]AAP96224.1 Xaa-Pro aminopeptidase [[Haemophilus] ducreyi 35000HP]AKO31179.1 proline aminopeptidase P II [[Haemophilus] ducreyi]AKO32626.1 proline aminopeptidase P II [[Haemophilus] ducreyi]AKO34076.1 proline aminopeptidase P II [[Haemophilus] ducreyi]AKO35522.1 proline aminopeptidase P II [[Haemophilus] ducreyi]